MFHLLPILTITALWLMPSALPASPVVWHSTTEVARGPGEKGPWQQNDSRYRYVDDPAVTLDNRGGAMLAWVNQAQKDIFFQRFASDGTPQFPEPVPVSRNPATFSWLPRLERDPDNPGRIYVLWQEIIFSGGSHGGDILFARSEDHGATFSPPVNLSRSIGGAGKGRINAEVWDNGSLDLIAGPKGALYAAWTEYEGALWFVRSSDNGQSFTKPQMVSGGKDAAPARAPSLALGADGRLYLAWTHGDDQGANIQLAHSSDGGTSFSKAVAIAPDEHYADAPKITAGPDGTLHLTYAQSDGGPFANYRIRYTRSADGGRSFGPARVVSHPLPAASQSARFPSLAVDRAERVYISYELYPDPRGKPRGLGLSVSQDGGESFSVPIAVPGSASPDGGVNGSQQGKLMSKLAVGHDGHIAIVNSSLLQDKQSRVWLMRGELQTSSVRQ